MTDREVMQQALEALGFIYSPLYVREINKVGAAMNALRERLAQSEQEPVAWVAPSWLNPETRTWESESFAPRPINGWIPLYTAPREWEGLDDGEVVGLTCECVDDGTFNMDCAFEFARSIETKLRERNA